MKKRQSKFAAIPEAQTSSDVQKSTDVQKRPPGRPPGKHSNPDYIATSVYLPRTLHGAVRARLFLEGLQFSALVERLLRQWLEGPKTRFAEPMKVRGGRNISFAEE
jgi:hypothetical protein